MKDRFGHLQDEGENETKDQELRGGETRRDNQYSEDFQEAQEEVRENINAKNAVQREREFRRDTDAEDRTVKSSITDVDYAITYELDQNFNFHVKQNNEQVKVPVIWDSQERWTWARQRRDLKSIKDKVLLPLITINRTDVSEGNLTTRPTITQLNHVGRTVSVRQRYSKRNRYDKMTALQNRQPEREYYVTEVPDFIEASYDLTIFTEYRWQMDEITDMLNYYKHSYWGDEEGSGRIFYTKVDSISEQIEMSGEARYVQADVSLTVDGYIVPEERQDGTPTMAKERSPSSFEFNEKIIDGN